MRITTSRTAPRRWVPCLCHLRGGWGGGVIMSAVRSPGSSDVSDGPRRVRRRDIRPTHTFRFPFVRLRPSCPPPSSNISVSFFLLRSLAQCGAHELEFINQGCVCVRSQRATVHVTWSSLCSTHRAGESTQGGPGQIWNILKHSHLSLFYVPSIPSWFRPWFLL